MPPRFKEDESRNGSRGGGDGTKSVHSNLLHTHITFAARARQRLRQFAAAFIAFASSEIYINTGGVRLAMPEPESRAAPAAAVPGSAELIGLADQAFESFRSFFFATDTAQRSAALARVTELCQANPYPAFGQRFSLRMSSETNLFRDLIRTYSEGTMHSQEPLSYEPSAEDTTTVASDPNRLTPYRLMEAFDAVIQNLDARPSEGSEGMSQADIDRRHEELVRRYGSEFVTAVRTFHMRGAIPVRIPTGTDSEMLREFIGLFPPDPSFSPAPDARPEVLMNLLVRTVANAFDIGPYEDAQQFTRALLTAYAHTHRGRERTAFASWLQGLLTVPTVPATPGSPTSPTPASPAPAAPVESRPSVPPSPYESAPAESAPPAAAEQPESEQPASEVPASGQPTPSPPSPATLEQERQQRELQERRRRLVADTLAAASDRFPYRVVSAAFSDSLQTAHRPDTTLQRLEQQLSEFPSFIRESSELGGDTLTGFMTAFQEHPSDMALENVIQRLSYLHIRTQFLQARHRPSDADELRRISAETATLGPLLDSLGIQASTPEEGALSLEQRLGILQGGLVAIQRLYLSIGDAEVGSVSLSLYRYLDNLSENNATLYPIYARYLAELDGNVLGWFEGLDPASPDYPTQIHGRIQQHLSAGSVSDARATWAADYYPRDGLSAETVGGAEGGAEASPQTLETVMHNRLAQLPPMTALAFYDYAQTVRGFNLSSEQEQTLITVTMEKLNILEPLLMQAYLRAARHLAEICESDPEGFLDMLTLLSTHVDAATDIIFTRGSSFQVAPLPLRQTIDDLALAFSEIARISASDISAYTRTDQADELVYTHETAPHDTAQRAPRSESRLSVPEQPVGGVSFSSPFPGQLPGPSTPSTVSQGDVILGTTSYGGSLGQARVNPFLTDTPALLVGQRMHEFIDQSGQVGTVGGLGAGTAILTFSRSRLRILVERAFIPTTPRDYSIRPVRGGAAFGAGGDLDTGTLTGVGLGSLITPTGGLTLGVSGSEAGDWFAGVGAIAVPLPRIPILRGGGVGGAHASGAPRRDSAGVAVADSGASEERTAGADVTGLDSAVAGFEFLSSGEQRQLVRWLQTHRRRPGDTSQTLIVFNREQVSDQVAEEHGGASQYWSSEYLLVGRDGTVYRLMGGMDDFTEMLNYAAGYFNSSIATGEYNAEPLVDGGRGGGFVAVDIGPRTPILLHAQAIPFVTRAGEPQPLLVQWTPAIATTTGDTGPDATRHTVGFAVPGQYLRMETTSSGEQRFFVQDFEFMYRRVRGRVARELRVGAGLGGRVTGTGAVDQFTGRAGVFYRSQRPELRWGVGAYYYGGGTDLQTLAILREADQARGYVQSLHRIGLTAYRSREQAVSLTLSGLGQLVEQLHQDSVSGAVSHDRLLFRLVGLLQGARDQSGQPRFGIRAEASRYDQTLDQMLQAYETMRGQVSSDPSRADQYIDTFTTTYAGVARTIMDRYSLAVQVGRDFSLEFTLLAREPGGIPGSEDALADPTAWCRQAPESVFGRVVYRFHRGDWAGFLRAFVTMPLSLPGVEHAASPSSEPIPAAAAPQRPDVGVPRVPARMAPPDLSGGHPRPATEVSPPGHHPPIPAAPTAESEAQPEDASEQPTQPAQEASSSTPRISETGIAGAGFGFDMLRGLFLNRGVLEAGILLARFGDSSTMSQADWEVVGTFAQAGVSVFSNILGDSREYRGLVRDHEEYMRYIRAGDFSRIPEDVRQSILEGLRDASLPDEIFEGIREGQEGLELNDDQRILVEEALWDRWFTDRCAPIESRFNGNMRLFLAAAGYFYNDGTTYFDIGAYFEMVDRFRAYAIVAQRESTEGYAGVEVMLDHVRLAASVAAGRGTGARHMGVSVEGTASWQFTMAGLPAEFGAGLSFRTHEVPIYRSPVFEGTSSSGDLEFAAYLFFTFGGRSAGSPLQIMSQAPSPMPPMYQHQF